MAGTSDGLTEQDRETRTSISLLIPWSCREGFTNEVCGLPGNNDGCWRYRKTKDNVADRGIRPCSEKNLDEPLIAWIIFQSPINSDGIEVRVAQAKPPFSETHHQAFFGFTKEGLHAFKAQSDDGDYPNYVEYSGLDNEVPGLPKRVTVRGWLREEGEKLGLSDCFGHDAFVQQEITDAVLDLKLKKSLSELIRSYLNHNPGCNFRKGESDQGIGITVCKVGVGLSKIPIMGAELTNAEGLDLLSNSAVSFSYVDSETLTIKKLLKWCLGKENREECDPLRSLSDQYFVPLSVRFPDVQTAGSGINFATSLSPRGRQNVLPSEVGKSFLSFPVGEICSYLLHWLLLRIFADDSPQNEAFVQAFGRWRNLVDGSDSSTQVFSALLAAPITLPVDTNVFRQSVTKLGEKGKRLGIYETPVSFGEALGVVGLSNGENDEWISATQEFMKRFFKQHRPSHQNLPMYKDLAWQPSPLLEVNESSGKPAQIEAIVACLANASGLILDEDRKEKAWAALEKHSQLCVFPIADMLANLLFGERMTLYYVFPLWEDAIRDDTGAEWRGPVIFAHVFTRALLSFPDIKTIIETGEQFQSVLLPAGAAIAHDYYNKERKSVEGLRLAQETAWKLARAWAHEVKNYTAPVIDELDNPILSDKRIVTTEKARDTIARSRRTILILNAASTAVQLSLGGRVGRSGVKASERDALKRLPRESAEGIVEYALQYLLNYRADVLRAEFNLRWTPNYTTDQSLDQLAILLNKKEREDEKKILSDNRLIWVIALLREVVWNIRIDDPFTEPPDELGTVNIMYEFVREENFLKLIVSQRQIEEKGWGKSKADVTGIELANSVFGIKDKGAGFGMISKGEISNDDLGRNRGVEITYRVPIRFALAPEIGDHSHKQGAPP